MHRAAKGECAWLSGGRFNIESARKQPLGPAHLTACPAAPARSLPHCTRAPAGCTCTAGAGWSRARSVITCNSVNTQHHSADPFGSPAVQQQQQPDLPCPCSSPTLQQQQPQQMACPAFVAYPPPRSSNSTFPAPQLTRPPAAAAGGHRTARLPRAAQRWSASGSCRPAAAAFPVGLRSVHRSLEESQSQCG